MPIKYSPSTKTYWDTDTGQQMDQTQAAQAMTAQDTGGLEAFLVGAGNTFRNVADKMPFASELGIDKPEESAGMMDALRQERPYSTGFGEIAPMLAPVPGGLAAQIAGGGLIGGLGSDNGITGALYGGAGGAAGHMAGRVIDKIRGAGALKKRAVGDAAQDVIDTGGAVRLGEATGSDAIKTLERAIEVTPAGKLAYGSTRGGRIKNTERLVKEALEIDPNIKGFGSDALKAARDVSKKKYADLSGKIPDMQISAEQADEIRDMIGMSKRLKLTLSKEGARGFENRGEPMETSFDALNAMRSRLSSMNKTPSIQTPTIVDLIDDIDDVIEAASPPGVIEEFAKTRSHYRMLKTAEKAKTNAGISEARLAKELDGWEGGGAIGDLNKNMQGLTSGDFINRHGNSGTGEAIMGALSLPFSPLIYGGAKAMDSLLDIGTVPSMGGAVAGRAGLLSQE